MPYADSPSAFPLPALLRFALAAALLVVGVTSTRADSLQLASRLERPTLDGLTDASQLTTSADGRYVAFLSFAPLVGPDDDDDSNDIFFLDRETGELLLVSHAFGQPDRPGNDESSDPRISADGGTVVFESRA
ncbi:MAG: hypothetical protein AAFY88_13805, partial [Acidobacteriota bacterium]